MLAWHKALTNISDYRQMIKLHAILITRGGCVRKA